MTCLSCNTACDPAFLSNGMCLPCNAIRYDRLKNALNHLASDWQRGGVEIENLFHNHNSEGAKNYRIITDLFAARLLSVLTAVESTPLPHANIPS